MIRISAAVGPWRSIALAAILLLFATASSAHGQTAAPSSLQGVLLLTVDSFRNDRIGAAGYSKPTTPRLDRFAANAVIFGQAVSQSAWTSPGIVSLLTSLYPSVHGMDAQGKRLDGVTVTPLHRLRRAGFRVLGYAVRGDNYVDLGFETERELRTVTHLLTALRELKDQRFFVWYHFRIPHLPYTARPEYETLFAPPFRRLEPEKALRLRQDFMIRRGQLTFAAEDRPEIDALYDAKVRELDDALGTLLAEIQALGLADRTLLVITADHGEELLDHGFIGHASTSLEATLYDEILRIPLIIRAPGSGLRGVIHDQVQQIDVMPTVFELLGMQADRAWQGRSLVPLMRGGRDVRPLPAFSETNPCGWQCPEERKRDRLKAVRLPEWKLVTMDVRGNMRHELYRLTEDPSEQRNLAAAHPDVVRWLESLLQAQERRNHQLAARIATQAGEALVDRAASHIAAGQLDDAAQNLERVEHLRYVYETQRPPFTREPDLRSRWFRVVARAYALLGRIYTRRAQTIGPETCMPPGQVLAPSIPLR